MFLFSCKENNNKQEPIKVKKILKKEKAIPNQSKTNIYNDMMRLKKSNSFTFLNYLSSIPKATLPINSEDYKSFFIEKELDTKGIYKEYIFNKKSIKGYPIILVSDFSYDSIKKSEILEISKFDKSLLDYSNQKFKKDPMSDDFFHYIIPVFYFTINDIYIVGYITTLDRGDSVNAIVIQLYDKKGNILDSKWDYVSLLQAESDINTLSYYYRNSNISKDYILTEKRKSNDYDSKYSNITIKYKITKEGLEIIE